MATLRCSTRWLLGIALLPGCASLRPAEVPAVAVPWQPFYWIRAATDSVQFDHAALLFRLQVRRSGTPSLVQLDLAGSGNMPHGFPPPARDLRGTPVPQRGQLYGLLGASATLALTGGGADTLLTRWHEHEVGTVGLLNYASSTLLLDFGNQRLAALPAAVSWQPLLGAALVTVELGREPDRVILPLTDATGKAYRALLDSGLSPFAVWTTQAIWQDLTGLGGPGAGTRSYRLPNPRGGLVFVGAPPRQRLRVGTWDLRPREIVYLAQGPLGAPLEEWAQPVDMVLGPALFARGGVVAIDLKARRAGFAPRLAR